MTGPRLHGHCPRFEETNDFVDFLLGLEHLASHAMSGDTPAAPRDDTPTSDSPADGFTHFVLGLLGLRAGFQRLLSVETRKHPRTKEASPTPTVLRGLLR